MIYPIKLYGDPILRRESMPISKDYPNLPVLINDMYETMHKAGGIGLSAIQIGIPIQLFVIEARLDSENFYFKETFINPVIDKEYGLKEVHSEGCLSIPGLTGMIERHTDIRVTYYDRDWKKKSVIFNGYKARIIQHEYDHLQGKLYPDHLSKMWRDMLEIPLETIAERKIETFYLSE